MRRWRESALVSSVARFSFFSFFLFFVSVSERQKKGSHKEKEKERKVNERGNTVHSTNQQASVYSTVFHVQRPFLHPHYWKRRRNLCAPAAGKNRKKRNCSVVRLCAMAFAEHTLMFSLLPTTTTATADRQTQSLIVGFRRWPMNGRWMNEWMNRWIDKWKVEKVEKNSANIFEVELTVCFDLFFFFLHFQPSDLKGEEPRFFKQKIRFRTFFKRYNSATVWI